MCACGGSYHYVSSVRICPVPICVFLRLLVLSLCLLLTLGPRQASCVTVSDLFSFGSQFKDNQTARDDDKGSGEIKLTVMFPFFGKRHNKLYVNNNGVISFLAELQNYTPENFPLANDIPILAPYWADVDISNTTIGNVWYRETREQAMLTKATEEIRAFSSYKNFRANWVFIATWDEVGFFNAQGEGLKKKNTFQAVLALDTMKKLSFVILNYAKIEWTTGANNEGNATTGLGGNPAQAGFNAGDGKNYFEIEGARTDSVINLTKISNVGAPGKWIFRIDSAEIQDVCSHLESGAVTFQPSFASMLGGDVVSVIGLCFESAEVLPLKGRIETADGTMEDLCCFVENVSAKCYLPPLFHTGFVNVSLNIDDRGWNYTGQLEIKNIMDVKPVVKRINPDIWLTGRSVSVSWDIDFFHGATSYKFDVLVFKVLNGSPLLHSIFDVSHTKNDLRTYMINLPRDFNGTSIAVVRVTALPNNCSSHLAGPSIYSDVFPVRYSDVSYTQAACTKWLSGQSALKPLAITGNCPCTLSQAEGDTAQFSQDPFCSRNSDRVSNCMYRSKFANHCIIPNQQSENSGTYVCCYDGDKGELLIAFESRGGGTKERYNFREDSHHVIPYFTYMQEEIVPYMYCCDFSNNSTLCDHYLEVRQPVDCKGYQPPAAAQAAGDPHIVTLDNCAFTFNGIGDFTLLRVKNSQATVQVRAVPTTNDKNEAQNATVFSAVAMKVSNSSSILEIRLAGPGEQDFVSVFVDSKPFSLSTDTSQLSELIIYKNEAQNGTVELTVVMEEVGLSILVQATEELLNIMVMAGTRLWDQLEGLLGNYNGDETDDLTARDGTMLGMNASMRDIHYTFGMSWFVPRNESLFTMTDTELDDNTIENVDSPAQDNSYTPIFIDEVENTALPNNTQEVCGDNLECQFDYMVTGKESIAKSTKMFNERFEERKKDVSKVVRCPYMNNSAIENGSRNLTGLQVGANITVTCDDGFHVSGSHMITCEENGEWNKSPPSCIRVTSNMSLPVTVAIGAAAGGFVLVVVTGIIIRVLYKKYSGRKFAKSVVGSDMEHATELPILFPITPIPTPVFENNLFMSSLCKLSEKGGFRIPRPTFVDPNIYSDFF